MAAVRKVMTLVTAALIAGTMTALAQDVPAVQDAPLLTVDEGKYAADSLYSPPPAMFFAVPPAPHLPSQLLPGIPVSREDRTAAVNFAVHAAVTASVAESMKAVPMVDITATTGWMPFANPFAIAYGYVPLGNSSNPFIVAKIPGWNPEPDKYSPEAIPPMHKARIRLRHRNLQAGHGQLGGIHQTDGEVSGKYPDRPRAGRSGHPGGEGHETIGVFLTLTCSPRCRSHALKPCTRTGRTIPGDTTERGRPKRDFEVGFFSITRGEIFGCNFFRLQPISFFMSGVDVIYYDGIPVISVSYMAAQAAYAEAKACP